MNFNPGISPPPLTAQQIFEKQGWVIIGYGVHQYEELGNDFRTKLFVGNVKLPGDEHHTHLTLKIIGAGTYEEFVRQAELGHNKFLAPYEYLGFIKGVIE